MSKRILILNLTRMGDLIQSTPLVKGLKDKYKESEITLVVSSEFEEFAYRIPYISQIETLNIRQFNQKNDRGELKSWIDIYKYLNRFLDSIKRHDFDEVYNLSHSKLSAFILSYLKIPKVFGFYCSEIGDRMTSHPWLQYFGIEPFNRTFNPFNLVDIYLHTGEIENSINSLEILSSPTDNNFEEIDFSGPEINNDDLLIGFQAGSSLEGRRWPEKSFAKLGDLLSSKMNAKILMFGVNKEAELALEIIDKMDMSHRVINFVGRTTITELISLLKKCEYLISNDTGTMHLAAALGIPIVGLFFAHAHPYETAPYSSGNIIFQARIPCAPCSYGVTCNDIICVDKVDPEDVFKVMAMHKDTGDWVIPDRLKYHNEVNIYETGIGVDGVMELRPLIRRKPEKNDLFCLAYRKLWLDSLNKKMSNFDEVDDRFLEIISATRGWYKNISYKYGLKILEGEFNALICLKQLSINGLRISLQIINEMKILDKNITMLTRLGSEIEELDQNINQIGLSYPALKPLSDLFNKRKENFLDDNIDLLIVDTRQCYELLHWEVCRLEFLLKYVLESFESVNQISIEKPVCVSSL